MVKDSRFVPRYRVGEAAAIARLPYAAARRWISGAGLQPVGGYLSFLDLVELRVVQSLREAGIAPWKIRKARRWLLDMGIDHPFASQRLKAEWGHVMTQIGNGPTVAADLSGQMPLSWTIAQMIEQTDYSKADGLASEFWPHGRDIPIVVSPDYGSGHETVAGRNLLVSTLVAQRAAGATIDDIASDFDLPAETVSSILSLEAA